MRVKYPRTYHLPWSEGITSDDKVIKSIDHFIGKQVVVSEKMDGENTSLYRDYFHARSLESANHPSQTWVKGFWASIRHSIPEGYRICGENLYAKHSILYTDLPSYFIGFSVWNEQNICLDWESTLLWFEKLKIHYPRYYTLSSFKEELVINDRSFVDGEGYVLRIKDSFHYDHFSKNVAKFVRKNHVQTDQHWKNSVIVRNKLRDV